MRLRLLTIIPIATIFLALVPNAFASHFRGAAMIPSVSSTGQFTVTTTAFWRKGQASLTPLSIAVTKPDGTSGGTMTNSAPVVDTSDSRFDMSLVTSQITLAGGPGLYQLRWQSSARVAGMRNGDPTNDTWDMRSAIYWDGTTSSAPIQFNFQAINNEVVRGQAFSQFLGAVASSGLTLAHDATLNPGIVSQPPGFSIDGSTGEMTIPANQTSTYLDNTSDASNGADYAFSGRINASNGSYVGFDWVLDAVDTSTAPQIAPTPAEGVTPDANGLVSYQFTGTNPLGGGLTWSWIGLVGAAPPIAPSLDTSTATLTWNTTGAQPGTYYAQVRASNGKNSSSQLKITVPANTAPANTALPQISGTAEVGQTLSASTGTWSGYPAPTFSYQWRLCDAQGAGCQDIQGATGTTYGVQRDDAGRTIRVQVTATNAAGQASASSDAAGIPTSVPANSLLPSIAGTTIVGQTLTASPGTWSGNPTPAYSYQWLLCDFVGGNCQPIPGATGQTYVIGANAVNGKIAVAVTATNAAGSVSATSQSVGPVSGPPYNSGVPTISGTVQVGQTLTASNGTWLSQPPAAFSYQWQRCDNTGANCGNIQDATGQTYVVARADVLSTVRVVVTGTNALGQVPALSGPTIAVPAVAPTNSVLPSISGTLRVGQTMTASTGTWDGAPTPTFAYQWQRCTVGNPGSCLDIQDATASTYATTASDRGLAVRVTVTASNAGGNLAASSQLTGMILEGPINTALPSIAGTLRDGQTLTAATGTWTGAPTPTYAYQWQRCDNTGANCVDIQLATTSSFELTAIDVAKTLRVQVTATNSVASASASSGPSAVVDPLALANTVLPAVSGTAKDGQTLTATTGTWTGTTPISYIYQWQRCDSAGASCVEIASATSWTYVLTSDDALKKVRVQVTATNAAGSATAASATTGSVQAIALVNTVAPSIAGTARDQQTLTADKGTWTGSTPISYAYQWQRCDADGGNCLDIKGETNVKYDLVVGDIGSTVRFVVTASNPEGSKSVTSETTGRVQAIPVVLVSGGLPGIVGTATEKETLTASRGSWDGSAPSFTYQWSRCDRNGANCQDIQGGTGKSYTLTGDDVGYTIRVAVTASNYSSRAVATSYWTGIAAPDHVAVNVIAQQISNTGRSKLPGHLPPASATEFTTTPKVTLKIASPSAATRIVVSNTPDFSGAETFDVVESGRYPWEVLEDGLANGQRTVYVRWEGEGVDPSLTATAGVLLDDKAPVVSNDRYVYENRVKGKRYRVWVAMRTVDPASGVKYMQFAPSKTHTFSWRSYLAKASVRIRQSYVWVRTADAAGNVSAWRKVVFPQKPVRKSRGRS